jgi:tetratricopeptide (TPR) repeat protein
VSAPSKIAALLSKGVDLHQSGDASGAEKFYDRVLKADRRNPDALNLKGLIAQGRGQTAAALALFDRAISAHPAFVEAHFNKAAALTAAGRSDDALRSYADALRLNPAHPDARLNTGSLLHAMGREGEAIAAFRAMSQICPQDSRGHYNLGYCLTKSLPGAAEADRAALAGEAIAALTRARALNPTNAEVCLTLAEAHASRGDYGSAAENTRAALQQGSSWSAERRAEVLSTLGQHLRKQQEFAQAVSAQRQALELKPQDHRLRYNLAVALYEHAQLDEAEALYKDIIATHPEFAEAYVNLGNVYRDTGRLEEAIALFEQSLTIAPMPQAYSNIAATITDLGWLAVGLMVHNKALSLGPASASALYNRAHGLLSLGHFEAGWQDHEARFDVAHVGTIRRPAPEWRGENIADKRILVWTEQGIGDQILHASMIPDVIGRAGHVLIECVGRMTSVFARSFPNATIIGRSKPLTAATVPERYDVQIAAGSLGQYLRRDALSFPKHEGYLKADPTKVEIFRRRYEALAGGRRIIGIAWRSKNPRVGENKSAELVNLGPILQTPETFFVNLQYGDCAEDLSNAHARFGIDIFHDAEVDSLVDMDAFFAQVAAMDAVVTTSNTAVHVAGSQNIPTWLLLPHGKGTFWYWLLQRADSPWYPAVTVIRARGRSPDQPWECEPAVRAAGELARWVGAPERTGA